VITSHGRMIVTAVTILFLCLTQRVTAQEWGKLTVISDPPNAMLYIDGQLVGQTPVIKHVLQVGQHTIYLTDQSRQEHQTKVVQIFRNNETAVNLQLKQVHSKFTVTSKPDSSEVYLLTPLGKTPLVDEPIDQGTFTFEIRNSDPRYLPLRKDNVYIDKNNPGLINETLKRKKIMTPKAWCMVGLGVASFGNYIWSVSSANKNNGGDHGIIGFTIGSLCLLGVELVALF
jgi:hypothetical protein